MKRAFVFEVNDSDGFWGHIRAKAETEEQSKQKCVEYLQEDLFPNGSLNPDFTLTCVECELVYD